MGLFCLQPSYRLPASCGTYMQSRLRLQALSAMSVTKTQALITEAGLTLTARPWHSSVEHKHFHRTSTPHSHSLTRMDQDKNKTIRLNAKIRTLLKQMTNISLPWQIGSFGRCSLPVTALASSVLFAFYIRIIKIPSHGIFPYFLTASNADQSNPSSNPPPKHLMQPKSCNSCLTPSC